MGKEIVENSKLIAVRVPPGDNWELVIDKENVIEGLVQTLTQYMRKTKFKGHYRLEPLNGKLFIRRILKRKLLNCNFFLIFILNGYI